MSLTIDDVGYILNLAHWRFFSSFLLREKACVTMYIHPPFSKIITIAAILI